MQGELGKLRSQLATLQEEAQSFGKRMKEEWEAMERFTDSAEVAKSILAKYPTQERVLQELESMQERERSIQEKMDAVEKLLSATGSPNEVLQEFAELRERIAEEKKGLRSGAENFDRAIQEQKSMFATFEKIRERTTQSTDSYTKELVQMQKQLDAFSQQSKQLTGQWEEQAKAWTKKTKEKDFQQTLGALQEVRDKKKLLDEIQRTMNDLAEKSDSLTRKVSLVAQQAKLLELRTGAPAAGGASTTSSAVEQQAQVAEVKSQLTLTQQEEEEFRRKREELKELIKKLWEQS
jgi:DNA-binding ferritin-like protein